MAPTIAYCSLFNIGTIIYKSMVKKQNAEYIGITAYAIWRDFIFGNGSCFFSNNVKDAGGKTKDDTHC